MPKEDRGIYPKYIVLKHPDFIPDNYYCVAWQWDKNDPSPEPERLQYANLELVDEFTFVLKVTDKHARVAMAAYAESVVEEKPQLARDLREILSENW